MNASEVFSHGIFYRKMNLLPNGTYLLLSVPFSLWSSLFSFKTAILEVCYGCHTNVHNDTVKPQSTMVVQFSNE